MKKFHYFSAVALCLVLGLALAICVSVRAFAPFAVLPRLNIPNMTALCLVALLAGHYLAPEGKTNCLINLAAGALCFGLLPWCAGFVSSCEGLKLAAVGGGVFCLVSLLFQSIQDRLSTGAQAKAAPILSALGLFLAAQCFAGILL